MNVLRAIWRFLRNVVHAIRAFIRGVRDRIAAILAGMFGPPWRALVRVLKALLARIDRLIRFLLAKWAQLFEKAPGTPKDTRPTPGITGLPLASSVVAVVLWYVLPLGEWLDLTSPRFVAAVAATTVVAFLVLRAMCRKDPPDGITRWLIDVAERTGLIWFERIAWVGCWSALWVLRSDLDAMPVAVLFGTSFFVLLVSPYRARPLTDELPPVLVVPPGAVDGDTVLRSFRWPMEWEGRSESLDLTVVVDVDLYEQMKSTNPGRPTSGATPDFTPWVIDGSSPEVDRMALDLRALADRHGFSRFQETVAVLGLAQSVEYSLDEDSTGLVEYWRYPIETVHDETGDCEDTTILAAALLVRLGYAVLPLVTSDHAALAVEAPEGLPGHFVVHDGRKYYYCETTGAFRVGHLPDGVDQDDLQPCPLEQRSPSSP